LINFLTFRSNALQSLALKGASLPNYWTKDDIERWILKSFKLQAASAIKQTQLKGKIKL
jgi:hypothetical protein